MRNPFYKYMFQQQPSGNGFGGVFSDYKQTVRCPTVSLENDATLSNDLMEEFSPNFTSDTVSRLLG